MSCCDILDILSVTSFTNIFSHTTGCLFVLLMVSFVVQKFLNWIRSHLFIFSVISIVLGYRSKETLVQFCQNVLTNAKCICLCSFLDVL